MGEKRVGHVHGEVIGARCTFNGCGQNFSERDIEKAWRYFECLVLQRSQTIGANFKMKSYSIDASMFEREQRVHNRAPCIPAPVLENLPSEKQAHDPSPS